jgi:PIN domain nuclease of toxin-antitoxin system
MGFAAAQPILRLRPTDAQTITIDVWWKPVLADMSPDVLIASSFLPGKPPRDPADRILAATARDYGATLITRDRALLDYGAQGYISAVRC